MITLGIETRCDETALAILETKQEGAGLQYRIVSSLIHSQADLHREYGGVYPTLAKREHGRNLLPLLRKILIESAQIGPSRYVMDDHTFQTKITNIKSKYADKNSDLVDSLVDIDFLRHVPNIDRIAITEGPGLEPALWVGISFAEILGDLWSIPLVPVNHMEGHVVGSLLSNNVKDNGWNQLKEIQYPGIALLISGGHTELVQIDRQSDEKVFPLRYNIIGQTKDDAVGEAYDKVARLLELTYPGGPQISKLAEEASREGLEFISKLPRPMLNSDNLDFSFSGLKTAVLYSIREEKNLTGIISNEFKKSLALEFEMCVEEIMSKKLRKAIDKVGAKTIIVGGGVVANVRLRRAFEKLSIEYDLPLYLPSAHVSGDNALMIALAGSIDDRTYGNSLKADGTKRLG
jgi:N6-L-threonylcarbamoyladenine synthase